jgi:zinc transport system substrate-binding protein
MATAVCAEASATPTMIGSKGLRGLRRVTAVLLVLGHVAAMPACAPPPASAPGAYDDGLRVWVSIVPQKYFVERIGADRVHVEVMVPPGFSPEAYEPKPSQIEGLAEAELYLRIGVPFEATWMPRIEAGNEDMLVVDQSVGIERIGNDPHIWLSPRLVRVQARTICEALVELDREHEVQYRVNLDAFVRDLDDLDATIERTLSGLHTRKFMVFHPAWGYFARDYDLEMIPVQVEGSNPSAAEMAELVRTARANSIKVVFAQPEFSTESAQTIASEIGGEVLLISPLAPDWMDNLRRVAETFANVLTEQQG